MRSDKRQKQQKENDISFSTIISHLNEIREDQIYKLVPQMDLLIQKERERLRKEDVVDGKQDGEKSNQKENQIQLLSLFSKHCSGKSKIKGYTPPSQGDPSGPGTPHLIIIKERVKELNQQKKSNSFFISKLPFHNVQPSPLLLNRSSIKIRWMISPPLSSLS